MRFDGEMRRLASLTCALVIALPSLAFATPGPDSVVVVANANVPESVALAETYAAARDVPDAQVCLLDLPETEDIGLAEFEMMLLEPLRACLDATPTVRDRIESVLLVRGVPLRVNANVGTGTRAVSLAAVLGLWDSVDALGMPVFRQSPGTGSPFRAVWPNPYQGFPFESGWEVEIDGNQWKPVLVTMLHARSYEDAEGLLDSALAGEASPPDGEWLLMEGRDMARGVLDTQYPSVIASLERRGFTATQVPWDADLTGRTLSAFATGTATIGMTIEGNTYLPGSIVDNLTSFGARPENFRETGEEQQVSISRWVEQGVAGVHGTVAEPLNNCFPNRGFLISYAEGATLAEAYHAAMPYVFWMNLVLGDPMAAPFAMRPTLAVDGLSEGATLDGATPVTVTATDPGGRGIESVALIVDGVEVAREQGDTLSHCLVADAGEHQALIVARAADDPMGERIWKPKGWESFAITAAAGATECASGEDAGVGPTDGGVGTDAGPGEPTDGGCSCRAGARRDSPAGALALLVLGALVLRRRVR